MTALDTPGRLETRSVPLPLEEERAGQPHLKRTLGRIDLVLPLVAAAFSIHGKGRYDEKSQKVIEIQI